MSYKCDQSSELNESPITREYEVREGNGMLWQISSSAQKENVQLIIVNFFLAMGCQTINAND